MPAPTGEPRIWFGGWRFVGGPKEVVRRMIGRRPRVKPPCGTAGVERRRQRRARRRTGGGGGGTMLAVVEQDVNERIPDLTWCFEGVAMMTVAKETTATLRTGVYRRRDSREQIAHLVRKIRRAATFDHQMEMIVLNGIMQNANALGLRTCDDCANSRTNALRAKAWPERHAPDRHVNRMICIVLGTSVVRHKTNALRPRPPSERHELPIYPPPSPRLLPKKQRHLLSIIALHDQYRSNQRQ